MRPGRRRSLWVAAAAIAVLAAGAMIARYAAAEWQQAKVAMALTGGDPARAPELLRHYGCAGCHTIPGIAGADGQVGGPLAGLRQRVYVAGVVGNDADNLVRWIVAPHSLDSQTAMPETGISEAEARDVAAYLYAH